jgi:uncharacterized membrane protein
MALPMGTLEFQSVVFGVYILKVPNCEWRKSLVFAGVGTCLQVSSAGNEYFVFWNSFTLCPIQYCEVVVGILFRSPEKVGGSESLKLGPEIITFL